MKTFLITCATLLLPTTAMANDPYEILYGMIPLIVPAIVFSSAALSVYFISLYIYKTKKAHYEMIARCAEAGQPICDEASRSKKSTSKTSTNYDLISRLLIGTFILFVAMTVFTLPFIDSSNDWAAVAIYILLAIASMWALLHRNRLLASSIEKPDQQTNNCDQ